MQGMGGWTAASDRAAEAAVRADLERAERVRAIEEAEWQAESWRRYIEDHTELVVEDGADR